MCGVEQSTPPIFGRAAIALGTAHISSCEYIFMAALWNSSGHYIFVSPVVSSLSFLSSSFFITYSLPSQIGCLPHFTHGVALVRIYDAGLKRAARGSMKIPDSKNRQKFAICAPSHKINMSNYITVITVVLNCCKGDMPSQWETPIFGPL